jgi:hypothetical protein
MDGFCQIFPPRLGELVVLSRRLGAIFELIEPGKHQLDAEGPERRKRADHGAHLPGIKLPVKRVVEVENIAGGHSGQTKPEK